MQYCSTFVEKMRFFAMATYSKVPCQFPLLSQSILEELGGKKFLIHYIKGQEAYAAQKTFFSTYFAFYFTLSISTHVP